MRGLFLGLCLCLSCLLPAAALAETPFAPGQAWTLSDKSFPDTQVVVDKVETWNNQPIVHVSVMHVPIPGQLGQSQQFITVQHMPFTALALRASVASLVQADGQPFADFKNGYQQWHDAKGGVYTITVGEALRLVLHMLPVTDNGVSSAGQT